MNDRGETWPPSLWSFSSIYTLVFFHVKQAVHGISTKKDWGKHQNSVLSLCARMVFYHVWYHNKHTMISLFHMDRLHVTWSAISAMTTLCCHCRACTRCHIQALVFTVTVFCDINTHRSTAKTSLCFASSTTSNLIVASMNFIFTAHMACVTRGGSLPLLIAVFEGGHFLRRNLPTQSKGILV